MNEKLAIQILYLIRDGMQGYHDILIEIKKNPYFFTLKDKEFADTIVELKELDCIKGTSLRPKFYEINSQKDCIDHFKKRKQTGDMAAEQQRIIQELQIENLNLSNIVLKLQIVEIKTKVLYIFIGAGATVLFTLLARLL